LCRVIGTEAVHPRALEPEKVVGTAASLEIPAEKAETVAEALRRALEISAKDGSIVLSAGSMFVTAEAKTAWQKTVKT
jgi:folylpolyglutamate synthase/dihydropteroate synthase